MWKWIPDIDHNKAPTEAGTLNAQVAAAFGQQDSENDYRTDVGWILPCMHLRKW